MRILKQYAYAIVGVAHPGYAMCSDCHDDMLTIFGLCTVEEECCPIFASDAWNNDLTCDTCLERIH